VAAIVIAIINSGKNFARQVSSNIFFILSVAKPN
jgi:hypothetical protein